jgi:hypothetical protein
MKTKRRPKAATAKAKKAKKRVSKKKTENRAKLEAERQQRKRTPFVGIMSKIRKGQSLTAEEQIRLDRAIKMARRGSKNQWGH